MLLPACTRAVPAPTPAATASVVVEYSPLREGSFEDCSGTTRAAAPCRVRMVPALIAAGGEPPAVIVTGDTLTFAVRSAEAVQLMGGLHGPLSRIAGRDEWLLSVRVPHADSAIVGYRFMTDGATQLPSRSDWRGPNAPPPVPRAQALTGTLRVDSLVASASGETRRVVSYLPRGWLASPGRHVLYMTDGGEYAVRHTAALTDTLAAMGLLPALAIVGVPSARADHSIPESELFRARDYNYGYPGGRERFLAHERFFLTDVRSWAESTLHVGRTREVRAIWGASSGGAFALAVGARHPELFAHVIALSPALDSMPAARAGAPPGFFLAAGSFEPGALPHATRIADSLAARGQPVQLWRYVGGHDDLPWEEALSRGLRWAFGTR